MIPLKKEVNGKIFETDFVFDDRHIELVEDVLECLKDKTVDVPDPDKKWTPPWKIPVSVDNRELKYNRLRCWDIPKGYQWHELASSERGMVQIPIHDWLPIVCKRVSFDSTNGRYFGEKNPLLQAFKATQPLHEAVELIPGGLLSVNEVYSDILTRTRIEDGYAGDIIIARELKQSDGSFRFVLAHEIQHAINMLEIIYPALINWKGFIFNVLEIDELGLDDFTDSKIMDDALDRNTTKIEIETLEYTFGHPIHTWYKGYEKFVNDMEMK